jgi:dTMP kinase
LCLFLDISPEDAAKRGGFGAEKYEKKEMQDRVRDLFKVFMEREQEKEDFVKVDGGRQVEEVQEEVREVAREVIERVERERRPLRFVEPW